MLSKSSLKYFTFINKLRYSIAKLSLNEKRYFQLILKGIIPRPQYALGLFLSASLASQIGYKKISVIEFGCWECEGLIDLEHYACEIEKIFKIEIEIYGFEGGEGLPPPTDYRDRLYQFSEGEMKSSTNIYRDKLKKSKIICGEFEKTIPQFIKEKKFAPIASLFNDADYFSSTKISLEILNQENILPKIFLYFDDLNFSSSSTGELGAINDFNKINKTKIEPIPEFAETLSVYWKKWGFLAKRFYIHHDFNHNKYDLRYTNPFYKNINN